VRARSANGAPLVHFEERSATCKARARRDSAVSGNHEATRSARRTPVITSGEIFPDGTIIELVRGAVGSDKPELLLWSGTAATVAPQVKYRDRVYEAPELSLSLYRAMLLPSRCSDYGSIRPFLSEIVALFNQHLHFSDRESRLMTGFCMSTWLADRLPLAPSLAISGPDQATGIEVLKLLYCLCRHPLLLTEVTPGSFRSLPMHLSLTSLINQEALRPSLKRLLRASSYRGFHLPANRGTLVDLYGPKAIFCGSDALVGSFSDGAIQISIAPSQWQGPMIDENLQKKIADEFQPRLLRYRLKNCACLRESRVDTTAFTPVTRQVACILAACLAEDLELARDTVQLLQPQDEQIREQRFCDVNCVLLEALWGLVHHGTEKKVTVDELAKMANALLRSRGENLTYSAEEIGWRLRTLRIPRQLVQEESRPRVQS
jgi:hypothetical protein